MGLALRTSDVAETADLGNLLFAGSLIASVTRPREMQELRPLQGS